MDNTKTGAFKCPECLSLIKAGGKTVMWREKDTSSGLWVSRRACDICATEERVLKGRKLSKEITKRVGIHEIYWTSSKAH